MISKATLLSQITDRKYLRRNLLIGGGLVALLAAVLLLPTLNNLLDRPGGTQAETMGDDDLNRIWEGLEREGAQKAAHSKMIAVNQGGKRWLYVIGGIEVKFNVPENRYQTVISNTVRRIELHPVRGTVIGGEWEGVGQAWGSMKLGHAEFGLVEAGGYLYVVAGDINIPPVVEGQNQSALLYSTVERLNLANPGNGWEVYALLSGINFYPEVLVEGTDIHVVGGVYGNPFPPMTPEVADTQTQDMLDPATDYAIWNDIKNLKVIGGTGLFLNHTQTNGGIGTTTTPTITQTGTGTGTGTGSGGTGPAEPTGSGTVGQNEQSALPTNLDNQPSVAGDLLVQQTDPLVVVTVPKTGDVYGTGQKIDVAIVTRRTDGPPNQIWDASIQIRPNSSSEWQPVKVTPLPFWGVSVREITIPKDFTLTRTDTAQVRVCHGASSVSRCNEANFPPEQIGLSDLFTVTNELTLTTEPKWYRGGPATITWETESGHERIAFLWKPTAGSTWNQMGNATANDGQEQITVSPEIGVGTIQIKGCLGGAHISIWECTQGPQDISDPITVVNHSVNIITPNAQTEWRAGNTETIQWVSDSSFAWARLWYKRNSAPNTYWQMITSRAANGPSGGTAGFRVPEELTSEARIAICLHSNPNADDEYVNPQHCSSYNAQHQTGFYNTSELFSIGEGVNFKVVSPNGGEFWGAGTPQTIKWETNSTDSIRVEFSANGGTNWTQLTGGLTPGTKEYIWNIPANTPPTIQGRIRISDTGGSSRNDISDANFVIVSGPISSTKLTEALLSGKFVTTVGEHFKISTTNVNSSTFGELKSDFIGRLSTTWTPGTVASLGHLRFMITQDGEVIPVPQGRYGHKLVRQGFGGYSFGVVGGSTWAKEQEVTTAGQIENFKTFWVIDHTTHPVYQTSAPQIRFDYGKASMGSLFGGYQFVGNIAYGYQPSRPQGNQWVGTNGSVATGNYSGATLAGNYTLKLNGNPKGRAFFGLAEIPGNVLAAGGLENEEVSGAPYQIVIASSKRYFRIPVVSTARSEVLRASGWESDGDYIASLNRNSDNGYVPAYNLQAFSLGDKAVLYGGQTEFQKPFTAQEGFLHDHHVPDYGFGFNPKTFMYKPAGDAFTERWFAMADMGLAGMQADFEYVRITPGIATRSEGSEVSFRAKAYNTNGVELPGSNCSWALKPNALQLGSIDSTSGVFTATDSIDRYRTVAKGVEATCTIGEITHKGFADIGVYPSTDPEPEPVLSYVEIKPGSAITAPGSQRSFSVYAYDQYFDPLGDQLSYEWRLNDPQIGSIGVDNQATVVFTATTDQRHTGAHPDALQVTVTSVDPEKGERTRVAAADIHIPESQFADGSSAESFAADYMVDTDGIRAVYHFGGVESDALQTLGLFGSGKISGTLEVVTSPIAPDGYYGSDVIVTLKNGLDEPVFQDSNGGRFAVRIDTSRSAQPVVTSDQTFRPGKAERVELVGEVLEDPVGQGEFVYVEPNGQARFRIYSNTPTTTPIIVQGYVMGSNYSLMVPNLTDTLEVRNIPGVPSQLTSTITADKYKVAADGVDQATVTVTLRDFQGTPVSGYHVRLTSSRAGIDAILPATAVTSANGTATFTIKSEIKGQATIRAFFAPNANDLANRPTPLLETLTLDFTASISELIPSQIRQGELIDVVTATGNQTSWATGKTTVSYISPNRTGITIANPNPHIKANGISKTAMTIAAPGFPNRQINLTIVSGSGSFYPAGTTSVTTNASGQATFTYQSGTTPGVVKIKAQVAGSGSLPADEAWFMLEDARDHPYELVVTSSPADELGPNESAAIRGAIYEYVGNQKVLVEQELGFSFASNSGEFDDSTVTSENGIARATFTRGDQAGPAQILVTSEIDGVKLGARWVLLQTDDSNDLVHEALAIGGAEDLTVTNLQAAEDAIVGSWIFRVTTDISADGAPEEDKEYEVVDHPFQVISNSAPGGPRLTNIDPAIGYRNANDLVVDIYGADAFFQTTSVVTFTPVGGNGSGIDQVGAIQRVSADHIKVTVDIANTATMGCWNVKVTTGSRVAELPGDYDFLVTTPNNIVVDVLPSPNRIPRDGRATSNVTIFVGRLDPLDGSITPLPNVEVELGFVGSDGGKLDPIKDPTPPDAKGIKTNAAGISRTVYTTDAGEESDDVLIQATVTIDGIPTGNTGMIIKEVDTGHTFTLTANPTSLESVGGSSTLTATVLDREGNPVINGTPVEFMVVGVGAINPARTSVSGGQGRATSTYSVGPQDRPQLPRLIAKATIEGVGTVYSNELIIPIGVDASKYRLAVSADRTSVETGSLDRATITATLTYIGGGNPVPVANWPVIFGIEHGQTGDYLSVLEGTTNPSGQIVTQFAPGLIPGNIVVRVTPLALAPGQQIITKTTGQTVSRELSTISAVPKYVPADNSSFSVVTVTVRNGNNIGLANKTVTLTSTLGTISPSATATTNSLGQAFFYVRSGAEGTAGLVATVDSISLNSNIHFLNPSELVSVVLDTIVPLQYRAHDRLVKLYLRQPTTGQDPVIDESYYTNSTDHVLGLPTIYLKPNTGYTYWAKGRYHLARTKPLTVTAPGSQTVNFTAMHRNSNTGLLIGDIAPDFILDDDGNEIPTIWHDNTINSVDVARIIYAWATGRYDNEADLDGVGTAVNSIDYSIWTQNYGSGAPLP